MCDHEVIREKFRVLVSMECYKLLNVHRLHQSYINAVGVDRCFWMLLEHRRSSRRFSALKLRPWISGNLLCGSATFHFLRLLNPVTLLGDARLHSKCLINWASNVGSDFEAFLMFLMLEIIGICGRRIQCGLPVLGKCHWKTPDTEGIS